MSVATANPPLSFHERPLGRLTVQKYEAMVASGLITERDRIELIEGALVQKTGKREKHATGSAKTGLAIARILPPGWHVRYDNPVRIPSRDSEPEPDISVARGIPDDYIKHHPDSKDLALVVEVSQWTLQADRALAETYSRVASPSTGFSTSATASLKSTLRETRLRRFSPKRISLAC